MVLSNTVPPTLDEKQLVNFGTLTKRFRPVLFTIPERISLCCTMLWTVL